MNPLWAFLFCLLWLCSACAGPPTFSVQDEASAPSLRPVGDAAVSIYVVNHGWHTGLVVRRIDIPSGLIPEAADFPSSDYLELGWGDWDYYQSSGPGLWLTLKASLWPTASVLHVVGIQGAAASHFAGYEMIRLDVARAGFARFVAYLHSSFLRLGALKTRPIGSGWEPHSLFYPARGKFHLLNTCNSWVASALEAAGYPMGTLEPVTAGQLMAKVRPFAVTE
ncbi:DUF2459 domain-containing protein [Methylomonas sp. MgM2]